MVQVDPRILRLVARAQRARSAAQPDPLKKLLDPDFDAVLWEYEHSQVEPEVPGNLHQKQREALESDAKYRWLFWGNQVGKTALGAIEIALLALGRHPTHQRWEPPLTLWASALTWELWEKILLPELLTWLPPDRVIDAPPAYKKSTKRDILVRADNGRTSRITGKAAQQGRALYQSARVHAVWLDEEHPEAVYDELQPRLVRHGGILLGTMTPLKGYSWIYHRVYEPHRQGEAADTYCSHAGLADNPSITPEQLEALREALKHKPAQLEARLWGRFSAPEGLALDRYDPSKHWREMSDEEIRGGVRRNDLRTFAGIDFGAWRFACTLWGQDTEGSIGCLWEMFSQRETLGERAQTIHDAFSALSIPGSAMIWGDAANPQDIMEINTAFRRIDSPYRVVPVAAENKIRKASVERIQDLLGRDALWFRRGLGDGMVWNMGKDSASDGHPIEGSRLLWEINNWTYPERDEGKAQKQDPDDNSADGADAIASARYALMSWLNPAQGDQTEEPPKRNYDPAFEKVIKRLNKRQKQVDRRMRTLTKRMVG